MASRQLSLDHSSASRPTMQNGLARLRTTRSVMKIARFTEGGRTRLGIVATDTDEIIDVGTADPSLPTDLGPLLTGGGLASAARTASSASRLPLSDIQLEGPIRPPPTFPAIGLNYADHVAESGMETPKAPVVFNKQIARDVGPGAGIEV